MLVDEKQKEGRGIVVFWAVLPMLLLFLFAFGYIVHEELVKGQLLVSLTDTSDG